MFKRAIKGVTERVVKRVKGDGGLVVALVLIAIGVALCLVFNTQISAVITSVFTKITTAVAGL
jgi:hypothetical protein